MLYLCFIVIIVLLFELIFNSGQLMELGNQNYTKFNDYLFQFILTFHVLFEINLFTLKTRNIATICDIPCIQRILCRLICR